MNHPFKVGERILDRYGNEAATVTELTDRGFKYKLDQKRNIGSPFFGQMDEGEVFPEGYGGWEKLPENWEAEPKESFLQYCQNIIHDSQLMTDEEKAITDRFFESHFK